MNSKRNDKMIDKNCPFCSLSTEKNRIFKKGRLSTIILSNPRLMPGHILVIPNRHIEEPWKITKEELRAIHKDITFVSKKLLTTIASGIDIRQNYRPFLAQGRIKVNHVHFHVLPRTNEDELFQVSMKFESKLFNDLNPKEISKIQKILGS